MPKRWGELNTMTIAFGQGLNVAPLQALMAVGALVNGGMMIKPTFLKRSEEESQKDAVRVVRPEVSETMRYLLRLNAEIGSAKLANIPGYYHRRQNRYRRQDHPRPLFEGQGIHDVHGDRAGG